MHSISDEIDGVPLTAEPVCEEALIPGQPPPPPHPIYFASLGRRAIRQAALGTQSAAGPSGVDAEAWRHMCSCFTDASVRLCDALASCARRVASEHIDAGALIAFTACRLLPLDKRPRVRPIGIGEVVRRIVGKAIIIVSIVGPAVQQVVGCSQLCAGQDCGVEAGKHAMQEAVARDETDGILMADATNGFNRLNRSVCIRNFQHLCPPLATVFINTYRTPACLYVDGDCILSEDGTTQGDPLAMYMYAIGMMPLVHKAEQAGTIQSWFADDSAAASVLRRPSRWWDILASDGPAYGYFPNTSKSILVVKERCYREAVELFSDTSVVITCNGARYLGAAIGSADFKENFVSTKVQEWADELTRLADFARSQP